MRSFLIITFFSVLTFLSVAADTHARKVYFNSLDIEQTPIQGEFYRPSTRSPNSAILMMHGCSGLYKKSGKIKTNSAAWIKRFTKWGYAVLAVDGFTPRGFRSMCNKRKRPLHSLDDRPFDAYGGLAWLKNQPGIKKHQIILIGLSLIHI